MTHAALQGGSASMEPKSRGNRGSGQAPQQQQGGQRFQAAGGNPQTAVQRAGRPRAVMQRRPRGGRAGESLLTPFFASDVPG